MCSFNPWRREVPTSSIVPSQRSSEGAWKRSSSARTRCSAPLHFCRDICNGTKHARLEAKRGEVTDKPINLGPEVVWELTVEFQGNSYTAAWFTGLCIAEWNKLLREKGLLPRRPKGK